MRALHGIRQCEVVTTGRPDVLIIVTDTTTREEEDVLQAALGGLPALACLSLVSAYDETDGVIP